MPVPPLQPATLMHVLRDALPLTTERLVVRDLRPSDFKAVRGYRNAPGARRWTYNSNQTEAELMTWTAGGAATFFRDGDAHQLGIEYDGQLAVGDVMLRVTSLAARQMELGWMLALAWQGRGFATEAASAVMGVATAMGAHRVTAHLDEENIASKKVAERLGMTLEARLIDDDVNPATGEYGTSLIYAYRPDL